MYAQFHLFQSHRDLAHHYWSLCVEKGDTVIDATCGNGKDTLMLAKLALDLSQGSLFALDIQEIAIQKTGQLLEKNLSSDEYQHCHFVQGCHSVFPAEIKAETVKLVVYNLGYLPGGSDPLTTQFETTLTSIQKAMALVMWGGVISITCYPGHPEGKVEEDGILAFVAGLDPVEWSCCHHRWLNRRAAPSLFLLQKSSLS